MLNKIYLAVLVPAFVVMCFFAFYAYSWLGSIGDPKATRENYEFYISLFSSSLWISTFILLILSNFLLWKTRRAWAMWTTFLFFAIFTIAHYFWLDQSFFAFKKANGLWAGEVSIGPLLGVILIIAFGAVVFLNQLIGVRLYNKMYKPAVDREFSDENDETEKDA